MPRIRSLPVLALAVVGLAACGSSSKSSNSSSSTSASSTTTSATTQARPASAEAAVCQQAARDFSRLLAYGRSTQNPAANNRADQITVARYRALAARPGITAQTNSGLTGSAAALEAIVRAPAGTSFSSPQGQQLFARLRTSITQLSASCKAT